MTNKKKNNSVKNNPSVSIVTINQVKRHETIKLTAEHINNQTYKNITEWVIVNGDKTLEDSLANEIFINELKCNVPIVYVPGYHIDESGNNVFNGNHLGEVRNISNRTSKGDIIVVMDDDDFYPKSRVEHSVQMLTNSKSEIAGCSDKYLYDFSLERLFKFKQFGPNHSTNDCMAYKRSYFENGKNNYDPNVDQAEEASWTKKFSNPMVQLDPKHTIIGSSHSSNTFNKREICTFSCLWKNPQNSSEGNMYGFTVDPDVSAEYLMGNNMIERYTSIFNKDTVSEFDIAYFCGGTSIEWDPTSKSLGGSEQAVVHLSKEWNLLGKKVAVYAKITKDCDIDGVKYIDWKRFPFHKKHSTVILWRMSGVNCGLLFPIKANKLYIDYHDNNFIFRHEYLPYIDKIDKIFFKSEYHLEYYKKHFSTVTKSNFVIPPEKYTIIPNGLRIEDFQKNELIVREPFRFCYCSCYSRGLTDLLMHVWPIIHRNEPRAELHVYYGKESLGDQNTIQQTTMLLGQPGVMDHGRRPVHEINIEKQKSSFHLYITDTNQEIDCISIRESLVTGCIPLISNSGLFKNRDGLHFELERSQQGYQKIAQGILNLIVKPEFIDMCRQRFYKSETIMNWKTIAEQWLS